MSTSDDTLVLAFGAKCDEARAALQRHMLDRGLHEADGWRIYEFTRQIEGRSEIVMRPIHSRLEAPAGLECFCEIDAPASKVSSGCAEPR